MNLNIVHVLKNSAESKQCAEDICAHHYLKTMPDPRTSLEIFKIQMGHMRLGWLIYGRPESTKCGDWYGGVDDVKSGKCEVTRWQVLNRLFGITCGNR